MSYCNFQRTEDQSSISVECETLEAAEEYAQDLVDTPVINITVSATPLYENVYRCN